MAITIPIVTEFVGQGLERAKKEFSQLEGVAAKSQYAIKKAAIPAAAALGAMGAALFDATKGAIEDAAAQDLLAATLKKTTGATDAQIAANEEWISTQGKLLGVTDSELRPMLSRLSKATGSVTEAQKLATQAMDIAASTGKPLATVTAAIEKAYGGNLTALAKLAPEYRQMIKDGATFEQVMAAIAKTTGGAATTAANTAEGQFKRLGIALDETKESIGAALIPVVEAVLPYLTKFGEWAQKNPQLFLTIAGAIAGIAVAITAVNVAMALNPFTAMAAGIVAVGAGAIYAYKKFEGFRNVVNTVVNGVLRYLETLANAWIRVTNLIIRGINLINPGKDIPTLGQISLGSIGGGTDSTASAGNFRMFEQANLPVAASTGVAKAMSLNSGTNVNINVNGGDPQATVDALRRYMQLNGSVPIRVAG
jgi:hypothetical protein